MVGRNSKFVVFTFALFSCVFSDRISHKSNQSELDSIPSCILVLNQEDDCLVKDLYLYEGDSSYVINIAKGKYPEFFEYYLIDIDHSIIQFECLKTNNDTNYVYLNSEKTKLGYFISDCIQEMSFEEYLIGSIIEFDISENPLVSDIKASERYDTSEYSNSILVCDSLQGEWMKLTCYSICGFDCPENKVVEGWIKWRDSNELLIRVSFAC